MDQRQKTEALARKAFQWEKGLDTPDTTGDILLEALVTRQNATKQEIILSMLHSPGIKLSPPVARSQQKYVTS